MTHQIADEVYAYAHASASEITNHTQTVEEAACHTLRIIASRFHEWDGRPLRNWAGIIARNKALSLTRKLGKTVSFDDVDYAIASETTELKDYSSLHTAINSLKPIYRDVTNLHYVKGLEVQVIAEVLGRPEGTVKVQLKRARQQLKQIL